MSALPDRFIGLKEEVRKRANFLCEYCHTSEQWQYVRFTLDHVLPLESGGGGDLENLASPVFTVIDANLIRALLLIQSQAHSLLFSTPALSFGLNISSGRKMNC